MAETEQITILKLKTEGAESVQDLKDNIKVLKQVIDETKIGTEEYQQALNLLKVNQNALKDAMYATSASMDDVRASATGTAESYNGLVHRMAALKEELRNTDVSTEEGKRRFKELAGQVNEVNDKLKEMDALQGNFQRNVGNYQSAFKGLAEKTEVLGKSINVAGGGINGFKDGFEAFGKSPAIATIGIVVSIVAKLAEHLKENETAVDSLKAGMDALKPVMDFFAGIIEKLADFLADLIVKVTTFVTSNGLMDKIVKGVMGVGNAIVQYVIAPVKAVIEAIKVFKEQGIGGFRDAAKAFGQEIKSGVSFKQNFETGQVAAETIIAGAKSKKGKAKSTGKDLGKEIQDGLMEEMAKLSEELDKQMEADLAALDKEEEEINKKAQDRANERIKLLDKAYDHQLELNEILTEDEREKAAKSYEIQAQANQKRLELLDQFVQDALDRDDLDAYLAYDQERADLEVEIETNAIREKERLRRLANKDAQTAADERLKILDKAYDHQLELNEILTEDEEEKAAKSYAIQAQANEKKLELLKQFQDAALERGDLDTYLAYDQERADLEVEIETNAIREKERLRKKDLKDAQDNVKMQKELLKGVAETTSSILGSIADMYESDEENSEKNANKIKALRIAAATIDTISGAVGAYMQAVATIAPPAGAITGAIQAAAVTAAGLAQIAQMRNTKVSGSAGATSMPTPAVASVASAPTLTTQVSNVRNVTSATEEDRLNQMASDQRVYILASDIEASQNQIKTQISESSF